MHQMLLNVPSKLETRRLLLRPYQPGDGQWLHKIFQENRDHLWEAIEGAKAYFGLDMTHPEEAEIFIRRQAADWITRLRFIFGAWEKTANRYVGEIWIENRDWDIGLHEIGYYVVKTHLGQGFATEATKAGLKFIFEDLKANKVSLTCDEDNIGSYRVAERCGFIREGRLRNEVKRSEGALIGKLYYGMLKEEFKP
jgi:RimJ/RimL family protein N-acetyltransferase